MDRKARQDIDAKIAESYLSRLPPGADLDVHVRIGKDYTEILEFARQKEVDLIVIGRQGRSAFSEFLFGGVTEKVARKAECPVPVVPMRVGTKQPH